MIKNQVAPGLRRLGFKGSGQNYQLPSANHWAMLGFQKSDHCDSRRIYFTTNLLVVSREVWDREREQSSYMPARPTAITSWGTFAWWRRLGEVIEGGQEIWWELDAGRSTEQLADAILWP